MSFTYSTMAEADAGTQDGDDEGIIRIDTLPTPEQAVMIVRRSG